MICHSVFSDFESLWKRRDIFDRNLSYGAAFAQYTQCKPGDAAFSFLTSSPYQEVKTWIEEEINANQKVRSQDNDTRPGS